LLFHGEWFEWCERAGELFECFLLMRTEWLSVRRKELMEIRSGCDVGHRNGESEKWSEIRE